MDKEQDINKLWHDLGTTHIKNITHTIRRKALAIALYEIGYRLPQASIDPTAPTDKGECPFLFRGTGCAYPELYKNTGGFNPNDLVINCDTRCHEKVSAILSLSPELKVLSRNTEIAPGYYRVEGGEKV